MEDPRSTLVHEIRNHLSAMLMFANLLETIDLPEESHDRLLDSAGELRLVVMEPDLSAATHHDLNAVMDGFWETLTDIEEAQLSENYVSLRADIAERISATRELWSSLN
ncbi:MAG TPA: hypothetical protein DCL16_04770 [Acidimicrobiaceae bacterium]|nr:hypothetical protein [Acidimicrobiaceae bacterium]